MNFLNPLKKYLEYMKIGFKESIEYKWEIFGKFLNSFIAIVFFIFVWKIIYEFNEVVILNGFTLSDLVIYFIIIYSFNLVRYREFALVVSRQVKSGDIVSYFVRPINFIYSVFFKELGRILINFFIYVILILGLIVYLYDELNLVNIFLFFLYSFFLLLFYLVLTILISTFSFFLTEIWGINDSINSIIKIFSGGFFPISFFPSSIVSVLIFTPFFYLEYQLSLIFLDKITLSQIFFNTFILIIWILFFILLVYLVYKKGVSKININGG